MYKGSLRWTVSLREFAFDDGWFACDLCLSGTADMLRFVYIEQYEPTTSTRLPGGFGGIDRIALTE
jgi:hypothetical protein